MLLCVQSLEQGIFRVPWKRFRQPQTTTISPYNKFVKLPTHKPTIDTHTINYRWNIYKRWHDDIHGTFMSWFTWNFRNYLSCYEPLEFYRTRLPNPVYHSRISEPARQTFRLLWKTKASSHVHKSKRPVAVLVQINPINSKNQIPLYKF